jgi:hypothetical protein
LVLSSTWPSEMLADSVPMVFFSVTVFIPEVDVSNSMARDAVNKPLGRARFGGMVRLQRRAEEGRIRRCLITHDVLDASRPQAREDWSLMLELIALSFEPCESNMALSTRYSGH